MKAMKLSEYHVCFQRVEILSLALSTNNMDICQTFSFSIEFDMLKRYVYLTY